ncbi:MAG: hypothetical protein JXR41_10210 [Bacteroidales bacterium]|nr:hypothetical protein [Bacteroidales bacterium]MBN2763454.1 hypothetical protein [Bacteroidales bacterium]
MKNMFTGLALFVFLFSCPSFAQLTKVWENNTDVKRPECVVYDDENNCLYVSNFNHNPKNGDLYNDDCVSKFSLDGELIEKEFVSNLTCPTGLCIYNGKLYIVERFGVVQFDIAAEKVETRYRITGPGFINDVIADDAGNIYVTVSDKATIYRISDHTVEKWLESDEIAGVNGIIQDGDRLIVGATGDSCLKSITLNEKKIDIVARFKSGVLDGIKKYGNDYMVSHFEGNIYRVGENGEVTELLDAREQKMHCADFEFIENKGLLIIPTLWRNSIVAYKIIQ